MCSAIKESASRDLLIQQMVSTISELDGQTAVENAPRMAKARMQQ